jgi:nickel transport protein
MDRSAVLSLPVLALILIAVNADPARAHKMSAFAAVEGKKIVGEAYFRDGSPVRDAQVTISDAAGRKLGQSKTDDAGKFSFEPRTRCDHHFVVDAGDGHTAEYTVRSQELPGSLPAEGETPAPPVAKAVVPARAPTASGPTKSEAADPRLTGESVRGELEAIQREIVALRADLAASEGKARWHDVLGGIGYILGMMGVAFYFAGLRRKPGGHGGTQAP